MVPLAAANPDAWTTFWIALVGAIVGGAISAATQIGVERYRANREDRRNDALAEQQSKQREADQTIATRVAARITWESLVLWRACLEASIETKRYWPAEYMPPTEIGSRDEQRVLADHMSEQDWLQIARARGLVFHVATLSRALPRRTFTRQEPLDQLQSAFNAVDSALGVLRAQYGIDQAPDDL